MDKEDVMHIHNGILYNEYLDLAIKKNEIIPFTVTWMEVEIIILGEESLKEKDNYYMILLLCRI